MELSSSKIKIFLIFQEMELLSQSSKNKKIFSKKSSYIFHIFRKMKLSASNIKKILYIFSKECFSYILGNENLEKILYISGNFRKSLSKLKNEKCPPWKNSLCFEGLNFLAPSLKKKNHISGETLQSLKIKQKKSTVKKFLDFLLHNIKNLYSRMR